jgi:hypothetical protein
MVVWGAFIYLTLFSFSLYHINQFFIIIKKKKFLKKLEMDRHQRSHQPRLSSYKSIPIMCSLRF